MMVKPVVWFEIYVQDMQRAKKFFETVFNIQLDKLNSPNPAIEMFAFPKQLDTHGATGALVKMDGIATGGGGTLVSFPCKDCAVEAKKAAEIGGRLIRD